NKHPRWRAFGFLVTTLISLGALAGVVFSIVNLFYAQAWIGAFVLAGISAVAIPFSWMLLPGTFFDTGREFVKGWQTKKSKSFRKSAGLVLAGIRFIFQQAVPLLLWQLFYGLWKHSVPDYWMLYDLRKRAGRRATQFNLGSVLQTPGDMKPDE